jgi:rod shape-determining protein MreC
LHGRDFRCRQRNRVSEDWLIFTYRDERKLFALISVIIVAALIALVQINAQRSGNESPISTVATSVAGVAEAVVSGAIGATRSALAYVASLPRLSKENAALRAQNRKLLEENAALHQLAADAASQGAVQSVAALYRGIEARVIGFPPENESRAVTIDKGASAGVRIDDGVVAPGGAVGRVTSVGPVSSTVLLETDYTSRIPAVVRRGHWWGIARGNLSSVRVEYIAQDAPIRVGDVVVTGQGRSFPAGVPIGTIRAIERGDGTLYQTAIVKPAVDLGALDRVVIVPR